MALYRILALLRKDIIWILSNKKNIFYSVSIFIALFPMFGIMNLVYLKLTTETDKFIYLITGFKKLLFIIAIISGSIYWTGYMVLNEKTKGTFLSILTTPLKGSEFVLEKVFFSFSITFFSIFIILVFDTFTSNEAVAILSNPSSAPLFALNLAFYSGFLCLMGINLALFTETEMEFKKILTIPSFFLICLAYMNVSRDNFPKEWAYALYFDPSFHFINIFNTKSWSIALLNTLFNAIYFGAFLVFSYFSVSFYFSNGREKKFSLKLSAGLAGVIGLFALSDFISPHFIKRDYKNKALVELKEQMNKNQPVNSWRIPIEDFFKNSEISGFSLSPNGEYLAYLKPFENRMNIYVRKTDDANSEKQITRQKTRDIRMFGWKENNRLIFMQDSGGDENYHIFSTSVTGEDEKNLTPFKGAKFQIVDLLDGISENHILIASNQRLKTVFDVYRLNVKTGERRLIVENPGIFTSYLTDHEGKLRVALSSDGLNNSIYYRETETDEFEKILTTDFKDTFTPSLFTFDNKNLYVLSNRGRDKKALQIFDPREKKILSTVFSHPEVDLSGAAYSKKRKTLTGVVYTTWKAERHFFDSVSQNIFQDLKSKFPNSEISFVSLNRDEDLVVVLAHSDRNPGSYYLYNIKTKILKKLAVSQPWIKEEDMVEDKPIQYTSRDGLVIHGYLSLPKTKDRKKLPVVVNPHGGPWARNVWGYNPESQFLASRGYAVFQMNFRGSTGYGKKFWKAGFKEWGQKMQDDITDGVQYLIDTGLADKNKIAIYGGSYGGYAVLAGLAFTPDLYACGISYVGVSNILTFLESFPPYWEPYLKTMYEMVGHPEKDKELLKRVSPFFHIDKIKAPLFVIHGANDPRVKQAESDQIVKKLESKGVKVPYLVKPNEGHGFQNEENRLEFYKLMEAFLEACLQ